MDGGLLTGLIVVSMIAGSLVWDYFRVKRERAAVNRRIENLRKEVKHH